jgi:hypothetical protein
MYSKQRILSMNVLTKTTIRANLKTAFTKTKSKKEHIDNSKTDRQI